MAAGWLTHLRPRALGVLFFEGIFGRGQQTRVYGEYGEAIKSYDKAIELNPQYVETWNSRGIALGQQGKFGDALMVFDRAIELDPQFAQAWYNKGNALKL